MHILFIFILINSPMSERSSLCHKLQQSYSPTVAESNSQNWLPGGGGYCKGLSFKSIMNKKKVESQASLKPIKVDLWELLNMCSVGVSWGFPMKEAWNNVLNCLSLSSGCILGADLVQAFFCLCLRHSCTFKSKLVLNPQAELQGVFCVHLSLAVDLRTWAGVLSRQTVAIVGKLSLLACCFCV